VINKILMLGCICKAALAIPGPFIPPGKTTSVKRRLNV
jgi:hypothetical protein